MARERPLTAPHPGCTSPRAGSGPAASSGGEAVELAGQVAGVGGIHRQGGGQPAARHHGHPVGGALDLVQQVARDEDAGPGRRQPPQQIAQLADAAGVEAVQRLVEHQQAGPPQQRARDPQPLLHPVRQVPHALVAGGGQAHLGQHLGDAARGDVAVVELEVPQGLPAGELGRQRRALDEETGRPQRGQPGGRQVLAGDADPPPLGSNQSGNHPQGRALAGAVGSQQPDHLARRHLQRDLLDGHRGAETLRDPHDLEQAGRHGRSIFESRRGVVAASGWPLAPAPRVPCSGHRARTAIGSMTSPTTLHGREGPLQSLRAALTAAQQGRGQLVLISGDAGIGKSALAAAFAGEAESAGLRVTWGRAWEFADAPPYFPVWPCLRTLGIDASGRDRGEHPEPPGGQPPSQQQSQQHSDDQAFHLWERVLSALASAAATEPVIWIVEDLHAADLGTLDLLTFLVQPLGTMRVLVVATMRHRDARLTDRKLRRLARMARDGVEAQLAPLAEADVVRLAEQTSGRPLPAPAARRLVELTGGNPLFVVECARASSRAGWIDDTLGALPPTVRQVVLDRVALLPDATRDALASGAVLGREFTAAAVARMHDSEPMRVIDTLLPAVRAGILREVRPDQLAFSHALVCDAVYEAISETERVRLHQRADLALAARGDAAEVLVERARHALAAASGGQPQHALAAVRRATELLEREGAFDRAFALHLRVAEARAAGFLPPATRDELLQVARAAREAGRPEAARRLCEEVIASARGAGDAEAFARAALLHAAEVRVAVIDPRQIALLEEAHRLLGRQAPALACRVLARLSTALQPADEPGGPHADGARGPRRRPRHGGSRGDPRRARPGRPGRLLRAGGRAHRLGRGAAGSRAGGRRRGQGADGLDLAGLLAHRDRRLPGVPARRRQRPGSVGPDRSPPLPLGPAAAGVGASAGPGALRRGRPLPDRGLAHRRPHRRSVAGAVARRPRGACARGCSAARTSCAGRWQAGRRDRGGKRKEEFAAVVRAGCFAYLKDAEATGVALAGIDLGSASREADPMSLGFLGEAVALAGTAEQGRQIRACLSGLVSQEAYGGGLTFTYEGTVGRAIGLLDAALGDLPAAEAGLREALARARARRHAPWVGQLAHELAVVLRRAGQDAEARALAEESAAVARELGIGALSGAEGTAPAEAPEVATPFRMQQLGDVWTVEREGRTARVKDSRGMHLLARLAERSGEEIHVLALASDVGASLVPSDAGEMLDDRARAATAAGWRRSPSGCKRPRRRATPLRRSAWRGSSRRWPASWRAPRAWAGGCAWRPPPPSGPASTCSAGSRWRSARSARSIRSSASSWPGPYAPEPIAVFGPDHPPGTAPFRKKGTPHGHEHEQSDSHHLDPPAVLRPDRRAGELDLDARRHRGAVRLRTGRPAARAGHPGRAGPALPGAGARAHRALPGGGRPARRGRPRSGPVPAGAGRAAVPGARAARGPAGGISLRAVAAGRLPAGRGRGDGPGGLAPHRPRDPPGPGGRLRHVRLGAQANLARQLDDLSARLGRPEARFLDVGTGVGALAVAMCRVFPHLRVVGWIPARCRWRSPAPT